jgi:hypothetical protein
MAIDERSERVRSTAAPAWRVPAKSAAELRSRGGAIPRPDQSLRVSCLGCGPVGAVRRVAVVCRDEREIVRVSGEAVGYASGVVSPVSARAVRVSARALVLAAPQRPKSVGVPFVVLVGVGMCWVVVANSVLSAVGNWGAGMVLVGLTVVAVWCGLVLRVRRGSGAVTRRDVGRARWLWERCWYCGRCGMVSVIDPAVSRLLPARGLAMTLVGLASELSWRPVAERGSRPR